MPEGIAQNALGGVFEALANGSITKEQFVTMMDTTIADYIAQNKK